MTGIIYLDNNATTRVDDAVLEAMLPYFTTEYGNAASRHVPGSFAKAAVEVARAQVARLVGASPAEVVFTSGATESVNLALKGMAEALAPRGRHIVTVETEHRAVLDACAVLERAGFEVTLLPVDREGRVDPELVAASIRSGTILVSVMTANNEIGTVAPITEIGRICRERGVALHTDATQAAGRIDLAASAADLLSLSAHKMHGPKGAGALVVRRRVSRPVAQIHGGGHEDGLRSGTVNVPAIVGFGRAALLAAERLEADRLHTTTLRDRLEGGLRARIPEITINAGGAERLPNTSSVTFPGLQADRLLSGLRELAASTGSACSSAHPGPSHVLKAIGLSKQEILSTVRFGVSRFTTAEEIDRAVEMVSGAARTPRRGPREHVLHHH